MAKATATIEWQRKEAVFTDNKYSRAHEWRFDGGAVVAGSSSPSVVKVPLSDPAAVDPEEALVASVSSCHMLWFLAIAARQGFVVDAYRDAAEGEVGKANDGKIAITTVILRPHVQFCGDRVPTSEELADMHHKAHEECFIANSLKSDVRCEPVS